MKAFQNRARPVQRENDSLVRPCFLFLFSTASHLFPLCAPIVVGFEDMSSGIRSENKDFYEKQDASLWLNATRPQLVVDSHECFAHA
jgi:hypothetical protein